MLSHGTRRGSWNTAPNRGRRSACQVTLPASGVSSPAMMRSNVVLPDPLGPTSDTNSPCAMARSMPRSTWRSCRFGKVPGDAAQHQSGHARRQRPSRRSIGCSRKVSIAITAAMKASE